MHPARRQHSGQRVCQTTGQVDSHQFHGARRVALCDGTKAKSPNRNPCKNQCPTTSNTIRDLLSSRNAMRLFWRFPYRKSILIVERMWGALPLPLFVQNLCHRMVA